MYQLTFPVGQQSAARVSQVSPEASIKAQPGDSHPRHAWVGRAASERICAAVGRSFNYTPREHSRSPGSWPP